jgi:DNA-binding NtrC family response regulator
MIDRLYILTPDSSAALRFAEIAAKQSIQVERFSSSAELVAATDGLREGIVLIDYGGCESDVLPLARTLQRQFYNSPIFLFNVDPRESLIGSVTAALSGVFDTGVTPSQLIATIGRHADLLTRLRNEGIQGHSSALIQAAETILQVAESEATVLIGGETGTGKELFARAIHNLGPRRAKPFVPVNCGAIAEGVLESELFGHERGSFTGAAARRQGFFELSDTGTIFLDEIGEIKPDVQVRLLRVLEQRSFMRVGGSEQISVNVRVIAASNRDLRAMVDDGLFREDLYYRLSVVTLHAAPLRDRRADIMPLLTHFLQQHGRSNVSVDPQAVELLLRHSWPGNIRELRNFVESSLATMTGTRITLETTESFLARQTRSNRQLPVATGMSRQQVDFQLIYQALLNLAQEIAGLKSIILGHIGRAGLEDELRDTDLHPDLEVRTGAAFRSMEQMERDLIESALRESGGNRRKAAAMLGIGQRTLYRKIKDYDLR